MTSFVNRIRQKIERERKHLTRKEISEKVEQDWLAYSEIEGIRKWLAEHPDLAEDLLPDPVYEACHFFLVIIDRYVSASNSR